MLRDPPELDDRPEEPEDPPEDPEERPPPPFRFSIARGSSPVSAMAVSSRMEIATDSGTAVDETTARQEIRVATIFESFMVTKRLCVDIGRCAGVRSR